MSFHITRWSKHLPLYETASMDRAALLAYAADVTVDNYAAFASFAVLLYDYCLTLPLEIEHIWWSPWNTGKVLFFATRYLALVDTPLIFHGIASSLSIETCTVVYKYTATSFFVGFALAEAIISLRTWAVWNKTRGWALGLGGLYLCKWTAAVIIGSYFLASHQFGPLPDPGLTGCFGVSGSNIEFVIFVILAASELLIFALTAVKGIHHLRRNSQLLLSTLYSDGLMFSMILALVSICNVLLLALVGSPVHGTDTVFLTPQRVMHSILSGRIILHLRQANARGPAEVTVTTIHEV